MQMLCFVKGWLGMLDSLSSNYCVGCVSPLYKKKNAKPRILVLGVAPDSVSVAQAPKVDFLRIAFNRLTDEQIAKINKTGKLPKNAKFVPDGMGGYTLVNNFFDITPGTKQLPAGFELKNDVLGFTVVVPKGTESVILKKGES